MDHPIVSRLKLAELRYREKSIEARLRQVAIVDLNKYYMALDWAIMKFHQVIVMDVEIDFCLTTALIIFWATSITLIH